MSRNFVLVASFVFMTCAIFYTGHVKAEPSSILYSNAPAHEETAPE